MSESPSYHPYCVPEFSTDSKTLRNVAEPARVFWGPRRTHLEMKSELCSFLDICLRHVNYKAATPIQKGMWCQGKWSY